MKRSILRVAVLLLMAAPLQAAPAGQSETGTFLPSRSTHLALGADLQSAGGNFGMGFNVTSPYAFGLFAARLSAVYSFFSGPRTTTTLNYSAVKLALVSAGAMLGNFVRIYGGGGVMLSLPEKQLSARNAFGGFGSVGLEFFFTPQHPNSVYLEMGGTAGGTAERISGRPTYGTGFVALAGTRFYF